MPEAKWVTPPALFRRNRPASLNTAVDESLAVTTAGTHLAQGLVPISPLRDVSDAPAVPAKVSVATYDSPSRHWLSRPTVAAVAP